MSRVEAINFEIIPACSSLNNHCFGPVLTLVSLFVDHCLKLQRPHVSILIPYKDDVSYMLLALMFHEN